MPAHIKHKRDSRRTMVRVVSLSLAGLMLLSVVLAAVWQW